MFIFTNRIIRFIPWSSQTKGTFLLPVYISHNLNHLSASHVTSSRLSLALGLHVYSSPLFFDPVSLLMAYQHSFTTLSHSTFLTSYSQLASLPVFAICVLPLPSRTTREDCRVSCTEWQSVLYFVLPKFTPSAPYLDASARTVVLRPRKPPSSNSRDHKPLWPISPCRLVVWGSPIPRRSLRLPQQ